ncbi:hypothetical protein B4113_3373 [Geobacillus sp. B4113_201601]|nr:hypothetical protein B4113_3373 [Geobacillus sp. B4113_201601]
MASVPPFVCKYCHHYTTKNECSFIFLLLNAPMLEESGG